MIIAGRCTSLMTLAMVKVFPEPVNPVKSDALRHHSSLYQCLYGGRLITGGLNATDLKLFFSLKLLN